MNNVSTAESVQGRVSRVLEDKEEVHIRSKKASSCLYAVVCSGVLKKVLTVFMFHSHLMLTHFSV